MTKIVVNGVYQEWLPRVKRAGSGTRTTLNLEAVIVSEYNGRDKMARLSYTDVISCAWRHAEGTGGHTKWTFARGFHSSRNLRPHPEADRVWAEYCAAVLLSEGAKQ